jgi:Gas vesicle synthesis protein GvpL/GvpF
MKWLSRCAVGHEAVIEYCLRARAVVPMKLFTIFENDFRATKEVERQRHEIDASMKRVAGRREWGVRIRAVPAAARPSRGRRVKTAGGAATGTSYLAAKKQARDETREIAARAQTRVNRAYSALAALSADARRHPPAIGGEHSTRLVLDAAFLVAIDGTAQFRAATRRAARSLNRDGYGVEVTGPWPPYNFIEA